MSYRIARRSFARLAQSITILLALGSVNGQTPFLELAASGTLEQVNKAVAQGVDINATEGGDQVTYLMLAVSRNRDLRVTKALLDAGAEVNAVDAEGKTALMYAAENNVDGARAELLLDRGADPTKRTKDGRSVLDFAAANDALQGKKILQTLREAVETAEARALAAQLTIELSDGTRFRGDLEAQDLLFATQYGEFEITLEEIEHLGTDGLDLRDGTRLIGAFSQGTWIMSTSRGEFSFGAHDVKGLERPAPIATPEGAAKPTATAGTSATPADSTPDPQSVDLPTEADARAAYQARLDGAFGAGRASITQFEKTDGLARDFLGVQTYTLEFRATVVFPQGWNAQCNPDRNPPFSCIPILASENMTPPRVGLKGNGWRDVGQTETVKYEIEFEKAESGWRPTR